MPIKLDLKSRFQRVIEKSQSISGKLICRQLTYIVDAEILRMFNFQIKEKFPFLKDRFCIIAIGGYGRMELAPHSDIDILYLHDGISEEILISVISEINTFLFDSGKLVGHSCRTIQECFDSLDNIHSFYSMLDSRFLCGSEKLFSSFNNNFLKSLPIDVVTKYNNQKILLLDNVVNSDTPLLVAEPDLKIGALGLRDIQFIYWIEKSISFIPSLSGLAMIPSFTRGEVQHLESAYDFILRARIGLHTMLNHKSDRMEITLQPDIAEYLGFGKKENLSSIDLMMNTLYSHQKEILLFIGIYLDYKREKKVFNTLNTNEFDLIEQDNMLFPPLSGNLFSNPETLYGDVMNVFYISHKFNYDISQTLISEIKFASNFLQEDFKNSSIATDYFLKILRESKHVGKILTSMHKCNVLGKFIPEFGACTNFSLFSYHHQYPVDEHTIFILRELDKLHQNKFEDVEVQIEFSKCKNLDILALSILLHDAGKVKSGDHCQYGSELATAVGERLGLKDDEIELLAFLVKIHIHMSEISAKRDISDPELISAFADLIGNENRLRLLYILTIIDTKSVGPFILTNWKKSILHTLFLKTLDYLRNFSGSKIIFPLQQEKEMIRNHLILKEKIDENLVNQILIFAESMNPSHYLIFNTARRILQHYLIYAESQKNSNFISFIEDEKEPAFITLTVYSIDDQFLLSDLTGTISSEALNVIGMRSYKNDSSFVITQFQLTDSFGSGNIEEIKLNRLKKNIYSVLEKKLNVETLLASPVEWGEYNKIPDGMVPQKVEFNNFLSSDYTILEILLPDSLGLLYRIIKLILSNDLQLHFVRVSTSADYAYDSFYLKSQNGNKIEDEVLQKKVESEIFILANTKIKSNLSYIEF